MVWTTLILISSSAPVRPVICTRTASLIRRKHADKKTAASSEAAVFVCPCEFSGWRIGGYLFARGEERHSLHDLTDQHHDESKAEDNRGDRADEDQQAEIGRASCRERV